MTNTLSYDILIPFQKEDKWGFKNKENVVVIEAKYDVLEPFRDGVAQIEQ